MSEPLRTTEVFAFRPAEVKDGNIVVPLLLVGGEWATLSGTPSVMRQLGGSVDAALVSLATDRTRSPKRAAAPV